MHNMQTKLLVVDDEPATRTLLIQILGGLGYALRSAEDGFTALAQIREEIPDILLSDLNMPGMSGFELLSEVRLRFPQIYVIATSGAFSGDLVPRGLAADAFYEKGQGISRLFHLLKSADLTGHYLRTGSAIPTPIWD